MTNLSFRPLWCAWSEDRSFPILSGVLRLCLRSRCWFWLLLLSLWMGIQSVSIGCFRMDLIASRSFGPSSPVPHEVPHLSQELPPLTLHVSVLRISQDTLTLCLCLISVIFVLHSDWESRSEYRIIILSIIIIRVVDRKNSTRQFRILFLLLIIIVIIISSNRFIGCFQSKRTKVQSCCSSSPSSRPFAGREVSHISHLLCFWCFVRTCWAGPWWSFTVAGSSVHISIRLVKWRVDIERLARMRIRGDRNTYKCEYQRSCSSDYIHHRRFGDV